MRKLWVTLIVVALAGSTFVASTPGEASAGAGDPVYVSLGDSVAAGFHPGKGDTDHGYVDDVWRRLRDDIPGLTQRKLACSGETLGSLISGDRSPCTYAAGSQLDAAVAFLEAHPGQVPFITITIGGNDLVGRCMDFSTFLLSRDCVVEHLPRWQRRLGRIVDALRAAAGPDVPIVGMTYYDPFLGLWVLVPGGPPLARASVRAMSALNAGLTEAYLDAGAGVADVGTTFRIDDFTRDTVLHGRTVPRNVAIACRLTWFCTPRFIGDVHPTPDGHRRIGGTFARVIRSMPRI